MRPVKKSAKLTTTDVIHEMIKNIVRTYYKFCEANLTFSVVWIFLKYSKSLEKCFLVSKLEMYSVRFYTQGVFNTLKIMYSLLLFSLNSIIKTHSTYNASKGSLVSQFNKLKCPF